MTTWQGYQVNTATMATAIVSYHGFVMAKIIAQTTGEERAAAKTLAEKAAYARKNFGARALSTGLGVNMLNAPIYGVMAAVKDAVENQVSNGGERELSFKEKAVIVTGAGAVGAVQTTALDAVMTQKSVHFKETGKKISVANVVRRSVKANGVKGLFRGLTPTLAREVPSNAAFAFAGPEAKKYIKKKYGVSDDAASVASGAAVGTVFAAATHAADCVKSEMQKDWTRKHRTTVQTARAMHRAHGMKAFKRGFVPRWIAFMVASAVINAAKEPIKKAVIE